MQLQVEYAVTKKRFLSIRQHTEYICKSLQPEDVSAQPEVFVSPPKWHLAHTTWFFEQFVLSIYKDGYTVFHDDFAYYFNSYYNNVGTRVLRANRGTMTRPTLQEVLQYRAYVNEQMALFLENSISEDILNVIEIGLQHEQQHQELVIYDIKYIFGNQPVFPTLDIDLKLQPELHQKFTTISEGLYDIGYNGKDFCWDNELGHHKVYLQSFEISDRLVTNAEYIDFIESGAYSDFNLWHADGWDFIQKNEIKAPVYWHKIDAIWHYYDVTKGLIKVNPELPVTHVSFYEAWAFAEWKGMRLPTEFEWEVASKHFTYGQLWEWTNSAYLPYPKFKKNKGALGEYNGKFMVNQMVLRGGSIASPPKHVRSTYRNFFQAEMRWLFSGIRLVK